MDIKVITRKILNSQNFRHGVLYTLFSFINNGISFILLLILAHFLRPTDYGHLNLYSTFVNLLSIIIALCTASFVAVSYFQKKKEELQEIIIVVAGVATLMGILLSLILIAFPHFASAVIGVEIKYLLMGICVCYFTVFNNLNLDIWRVEEKPVYYGLYSLSFAICNFILTIWFIAGEHLGWEGRVYAQFILGILYFIISCVFLFNRKYLVFKLPSKSIILETFIFSLPLIPHSASFWIKQGMDRYIINYFYDATIVGYFSFSMNLAAIITMIGTAFNATNSVYSYKQLNSHDEGAIRKLKIQAKIMSVIFLSVCILVIGGSYILIHFFLPQYNQSLNYILPLCLGAFFQCIYYLWVNYIIFYKKTVRLMNITLGTAILQLALSIWLTRYSSLFTAWVSMTISCLTVLLIYFYSNKLIDYHQQKTSAS